MEIVTWSPFRELTRMEDTLNRMLGDDFGRRLWQLEMPTTDVYEEEGKLVVEANLPKFKEEEIQISSTDSDLEIKAQHKEEKEIKERKYFLHESSEGSYWRRVSLPEGAKAGEAKATFADGILKVTMPVAEKAEPKTIAIGNGAGE